MKLKDPEMFKPAWWTRNSTFRVNGSAGGEAQAHAVSVTFPVKENSKGELIVANHSDLEIRHTGAHDPDWRRDISSMFGVRVGLATEFAGHLFCPTTGKKISVGRIDGNPALWCDVEYRTAMLCRGLKYETADSPPIPAGTKIAYSFLNPAKVKVFMARLMPILREAKLRCALLELKPEFDRGTMLRFIRCVHDDLKLVSVEGVLGAVSLQPHTAAANSYMCVLAWGCDNIVHAGFTDEIKDLCADQYTSTYLEYRP